MQSNFLKNLRHEDIKKHVIESLKIYWPKKTQRYLDKLPKHKNKNIILNDVLSLKPISIPKWAKECSVNGIILVPEEACQNTKELYWESVDWWTAAFIMLECIHERMWDTKKGPIHSYSFHLKNWDKRVWERAWVNRIAIFLRIWASKLYNSKPENLFGHLPVAEIQISHDVDAINKTNSIRFKQSIFLLFNALRHLLKLDFKAFLSKFKCSVYFLLRTSDWSKCIYKTIQILNDFNYKSTFNFFARCEKWSIKDFIFNPSYDVNSIELKKIDNFIKKKNFKIGLHQSYDSWKNKNKIIEEKRYIEKNLKVKITSCRQHWLKFSWHKTWYFQSKAGLKLDTTLMFNDKIGFRSSAAICWTPFCQKVKSIENINFKVLPTILMDSHLYDYENLNLKNIKTKIEKTLDELIAVGGQASILWHSHTLNKDYIGKMFKYLLIYLKKYEKIGKISIM